MSKNKKGSNKKRYQAKPKKNNIPLINEDSDSIIEESTSVIEENTDIVTNNNQIEIQNKPKKFKKIITIGSVIIFISSASVLFAINKVVNNNQSYEKLLLTSRDIENLSEKDLMDKINSVLTDNIKNSKIKISVNNEILEFAPEDLNIYYDLEKISKDIKEYDTNRNILSEIKDILSGKELENKFEFSPSIKEEDMKKFTFEILRKYLVKAENAKIKFTKDGISASPEQIGIELRTPNFKKDFMSYINSNFTGEPIELEFMEIKPYLTQEVANKLEVISTFKTKLHSHNINRTNNIKLFSKALSKSIIAPGEEFSFDKAGGDRTWSDGYRKAPGFEDKKVIEILAGGICQVTTTAYNALRKANLEITERHPHSLPVAYATKGNDAAIAKGVLDLKFKNNTKGPIILESYIDNGYHVFTVWGVNPEK